MFENRKGDKCEFCERIKRTEKQKERKAFKEKYRRMLNVSFGKEYAEGGKDHQGPIFQLLHSFTFAKMVAYSALWQK